MEPEATQIVVKAEAMICASTFNNTLETLDEDDYVW